MHEDKAVERQTCDSPLIFVPLLSGVLCAAQGVRKDGQQVPPGKDSGRSFYVSGSLPS